MRFIVFWFWLSKSWSSFQLFFPLSFWCNEKNRKSIAQSNMVHEQPEIAKSIIHSACGGRNERTLANHGLATALLPLVPSSSPAKSFIQNGQIEWQNDDCSHKHPRPLEPGQWEQICDQFAQAKPLEFKHHWIHVEMSGLVLSGQWRELAEACDAFDQVGFELWVLNWPSNFASVLKGESWNDLPFPVPCGSPQCAQPRPLSVNRTTVCWWQARPFTWPARHGAASRQRKSTGFSTINHWTMSSKTASSCSLRKPRLTYWSSSPMRSL